MSSMGNGGELIAGGRGEGGYRLCFKQSKQENDRFLNFLPDWSEGCGEAMCALILHRYALSGDRPRLARS